MTVATFQGNIYSGITTATIVREDGRSLTIYANEGEDTLMIETGPDEERTTTFYDNVTPDEYLAALALHLRYRLIPIE